jgi:hypothetical protein
MNIPRSNREEEVGVEEESVLLLLQVPRTNDKKELAAEQMFASLHGLLIFPAEKRFQPPKRERVSFEIAVLKRRIGFYVSVPKYLMNFVEEQIYAQYPTVQISEVEDYARANDNITQQTLVSEMRLIANDALPIKTFQSFEVDPLAAITATLAKFDENEEAWIQLVLQPASTNWHKRSEKYITGLRGGSGSTGVGTLFNALWTPPDNAAGGGQAAKLTEYDTARASGAEEKSHKLAFESCLRIVYKGNVSSDQARLRLQSIVASYKQFNTTYMNGFEQANSSNDNVSLLLYQRRSIGKKYLTLNIEEIATLYHLPHTTVETPYILWALSQTAEPPANLPLVSQENLSEISPVAVANFRGHNMAFGLPRIDRGRHLYILGQTGVGKSALLELLTISDINSPYGFAVIDPHGDYALSILRRIPAARADSVIYFNPADTEFPIAFNPMEVTDPKLKTHTVSELVGVLKRMFESWGPRLEYILRYSLLALLDYPDTTMLDITRILTEKAFRNDVISYVTDPVVKNFWTVEFASWNDKFAAEAVAPVLNKVGAFTANPIVRNIIGQPKSSFNIREIMDERKILIINLSRGLVGEDNAALLGSLLVTKIQLASMSRADIPVEQRVPFYLYVDEFQNFATDSFATILSEARKYALNLTVANQYISQMPIEVKDAVFGNVGSMVSFRMGADDARGMLKYFEPKFEEYDLVHMHNRHFVISMTINGEKSQAFSAVTIDLPKMEFDQTDRIIQHSRAQYAFDRSEVNTYISKRYLLDGKPITSMPKTPKPPRRDDNRQVKATQPAAVPPPKLKQAEAPNQDSKPKNRPTMTLGRTAISRVSEQIPKPKRARKRRRKKKPEAAIAPAVNTSSNDNRQVKATQSAAVPPPKLKQKEPATAGTLKVDTAEHVIFSNNRRS